MNKEMSTRVALFYETDSCRRQIESVLHGEKYDLNAYPIYELDSISTPEYVLFEPEIIMVYSNQNFNELRNLIRWLHESLPGIPKIFLTDHKIDQESKSEFKSFGISAFGDGGQWLKSLPARLNLIVSKTGKKPTFQHVNRKLFNTIKRNKLLFEESRDGLIIGVPSSGHVVEANQSFCDLIGYTKQEITDLKREDFVELEPGVLEERRKKQVFQGEIALKHKSGTLIPAEISSQIIEMDDGSELSLSIIRDMRKLRELRYLEEQKEKRELLLKDLSLIINQEKDFKKSVKKCLFRISRFLDWPLAHAFFRKEFGEEGPFVASEIWFNENKHTFDSFIRETENTTFESEGCVSKVAELKEPLWISTSEPDKFIRSTSAMDCGLEHGLMLPVIVKGNTEAVIEFFTGNYSNREQDTLNMMGVISQQLAQLFERKITLDELKAEKEKFRLIAENSSDMISIHSINGTYTYVSPSCSNLIGYEQEELIGMNPYDIIYEADKKSVRDYHHRLIHGEAETRTIHYRIIKKNGEYQWVETTNRVNRKHSSGEVTEIQASTRDITFRKAYETELKEHVNFNKSVINSLPGVFFILSEDGVLERANKKLRDTLQYNGSELIGSFYGQFIPESHHDKAEKAVQKAFSEGSVQLEINLLSKSGEEVPHLLSAYATHQHGRPILLGIGINITDQKKAESKLKQSLKEKQTLLAEVHHRVKNNLALVSGMMQLQAFQTSNEEVQHYFRESSTRIKSISIIHELLYQSLSFNKLSFNETIKRLSEQIRLSVGAENRVDLSFSLQTLDINVNLAIPATLILNELLTNIYKHAFDGLNEKGRIAISLRESDEGCITLQVNDNGPGLPQNFSLEDSETLGLTLIKILVNQIDGDISFDSGEKGTKATVKFKRQDIKGSASSIL